MNLAYVAEMNRNHWSHKETVHELSKDIEQAAGGVESSEDVSLAHAMA